MPRKSIFEMPFSKVYEALVNKVLKLPIAKMGLAP